MRTALDLLFTVQCLGCDAPGETWCETCDAEVEPFEVPAPEAVGRCVAVASYAGPVGVALQRVKYGRDRIGMVRLARRFSAHGAPFAHGHDAIVPTPSPWTRAVWRGFSAAAILAHHLSRASGVPVVEALRIAPGRRQAGLGAGARARNLGGRIRAVRAVQGRVLLVDDVLTTGATVGVSAREMLGDLAQRVDALVLCATDRHSA